MNMNNYLKIIKTVISILLISFSIGQTQAEPGDLIITEIFTRSNGNIPDYIEIYNRSLFSHDLLGWKISIYGTDYILDNENSIDALQLSPFSYIVITGRDGYFTDENNKVYLSIGDERLDPQSQEYNSNFASFVSNSNEYEIVDNFVWSSFALSHSASVVELINDDNVTIDIIEYNSSQYQMSGDYTGHSIELTNDIPQGIIPFNPLNHSPDNWSYSKRSRPFMFSSDELYSTENLSMEFGSPGKRNFLSSNISVTNLQCGPDEAGSEFCDAPGSPCVSQNDAYNTLEVCTNYHGDDLVNNYFKVYQNSGINLCWYECVWSETLDYNNMNIDNPKYNIYHDRQPGGTKSLIFDANQSVSHQGDEIIDYKWYKGGNVFQNGISIESEFAQGAHELVLLIKNEDDIWAIDTFKFEINEPNREPSPIISVDATEYVVAHNGDPAPAATGITLSGVNSCDCNDYSRYEFLRNGVIINDENYDCSCEPTVDNPVDWVEYLKDKCENKNQIECINEDNSDFCWWNPDGEDSLPETNGACEYSEIEYYFWTKNGDIQGTSKEFVSYIPDIGDYVFSLILTDTYGENNSASTEIVIKKELNLPPKANIIGETTISNFTPSNGIPYDQGILELEIFDDSYDIQLSEGQNGDDIIFSQWYTIEGEKIKSDDSQNDAHEIELGLGTYTFVLEVMDSYNCYSKNDYGVYLNMCGSEPCVDVCYAITDEPTCSNTYSGCRWYQNTCTPYCELYAQGFCDGLGGVSNTTPCHVSGLNVSECGLGGSCIFNDEYCDVFENDENGCRCGSDGIWNSELELCSSGEGFEYCSWNPTSDSSGNCIGDLQSANYDTLTVILSEENSPPIADIGTNLFEYMEEVSHEITPSVYDIEFYNLSGDGLCYNDLESDKCDPTIPPIFDTREEKCCVQVQWEVVASHYGGFIDSNDDGIDDGWYYCGEEDLTHPYCSGSWLLTPEQPVLTMIPPENTDFYPDSVRLRLTATDPFYNAGFSELYGQDEVIIIIENDNQPPIQSQDFSSDGYYIVEDDPSTFLQIDLSSFFYDPDGEILRYSYSIPNNFLIDESQINLTDDGYIENGILNLENKLDMNGDIEVLIFASDSEYSVQASFFVGIVPNNDIPNIYSENYSLLECTDNCLVNENIFPISFGLDGDPGGCGIDNNSDECEDGDLSILIEDDWYPKHGDVLPLEIDGIIVEDTYNYFPYQDFFGHDTLFFQIIDIGSSAGLVDTLVSDKGYISFYVEKSDNKPPVVQRSNFTLKEDYLIHFTASNDSLTYIDSLNHVYIGLDVLDNDNNCFDSCTDCCNDTLFNFDSLKVYVQTSSISNDFFTITDTNLSVIVIEKNYNNSLIVPIKVRDHEFELGNYDSDEYLININLIPVNDKPYADSTIYTFNEDDEFDFQLDGNDFELDSLSYEIIKLPTKLDSIFPSASLNESITFDFGETPSISYKPLKDFNGLDSLVYLIHDDGTTNGDPDSLTSDPVTIFFNVLQVNDPPRIDTVYFQSDTLISSLKEDTSDVKVYFVYTDIDADQDLNQSIEGPSSFNLTWEFNTTHSESGLKFWFKNDPPMIEEFYEDPERRLGSFIIDSLLANWNGTDSSTVKITDVDGDILNYQFILSVDAVNDPPTISSITIDTSAIDTAHLWDVDFNDLNEVLIAEDSKNIPLNIDYFDIDTDSNLNIQPDTISSFEWSFESVNNKLEASYKVEYIDEYAEDRFIFKIDSIAENWNGTDYLITGITDMTGDSFFDTLKLEIYQVNDSPDPFFYYPQLNQYPLNFESNSFFVDKDAWTLRLPYQNSAISDQYPEEVLIKWKRTKDIDLIDSLNNYDNRIKDLFYRVELIGDRSGYTYVLDHRINDDLFNNLEYCTNILELSTEEECIELGILDTTYAYSKIDLTKTFLTYKGSYYDSLYATPDTIYKKLDLTNDKFYYCDNDLEIAFGTSNCNDICDGVCASTNYMLNIVAYNANRAGNPDDIGGDEGYDFKYHDSPQYANIFEGDSANFNIDFTLPNFQFNIIRNDIFWEYYDLYITNNEPILGKIDELNYSPTLVIKYSNEIIDTVERTTSEHGPIHYTSQFLSEDSITFIYSARDLVENYGSSSKTISYKIIDPLEKSIISTPSKSSNLVFEIGATSEYTGIIAYDSNEFNSQNDEIIVSFLPENQIINTSVRLSFNLDLINIPNGNFWNYELYRKLNDNWIRQNTIFEKYDNLIFTDINELGKFKMIYNQNAYKPVPSSFVLHKNYPNPFNGTTNIRFELPQEGNIDLQIINILGESIKSIYAGKLKANFYNFTWDGYDNNLKNVSSGIYFVQLDYKNKRFLNKIMYMK